MDYIYDIVLNFQNKYYDFYEWKASDKVINIKKIPVYIVNTEDYMDLKYNDIILDKKTLENANKMFLITNGVEVMGILLDKEGRVIKRSSLLFDESDEVLEDKKNIKQLSIKYKKNTYKKHESISRIIEEKIDYINSFFNKIEIDKDEYLLKYIYHDIFNKEESDKNTVYSELKKLIKIDLDKIYNSIKKVNMELKK